MGQIKSGNVGLGADDVGRINKSGNDLGMGSGRPFIGIEFGAKRTTDYVLGACNLFVWLEGREWKMSRENVLRQKGLKGVLIKKWCGE